MVQIHFVRTFFSWVIMVLLRLGAKHLLRAAEFLDRTAALIDLVSGEVTPELEASFHKTIKKVTDDIDLMKFNTAIATLMSLLNENYEAGKLTKKELSVFIRLLCPFAPHLCEEMWEQLGEKGFISLQ